MVISLEQGSSTKWVRV